MTYFPTIFVKSAALTLRVRVPEPLKIKSWPILEGYFKPKGPTLQGYMPVTPRSDGRVWLQRLQRGNVHGVYFQPMFFEHVSPSLIVYIHPN